MNLKLDKSRSRQKQDNVDRRRTSIRPNHRRHRAGVEENARCFTGTVGLSLPCLRSQRLLFQFLPSSYLRQFPCSSLLSRLEWSLRRLCVSSDSPTGTMFLLFPHLLIFQADDDDLPSPPTAADAVPQTRRSSTCIIHLMPLVADSYG